MNALPLPRRPVAGRPVSPPPSGERDAYGFAHATADPVALAAFAEATWAVCAHRPEAGPALERALGADPQMAAAHLLRGFASVVLARSECMAAARGHLAAALAVLRQRTPTTDEIALSEALALAVEGHLAASADRLEARLAAAPDVLLLIKLSQALRFMRGDLAGMARLTTATISRVSPSMAGYGFVLGCHAFAQEESGDYARAERLGRAAVEREPHDAWGLHAVAHVYEMTGRTSAGIAWLEATRGAWSGCNNFAFHVAWHLALFHLEAGDSERVLALYDAEVRPTPTDDFRDVANAVSLLWRLRQHGVEVGDRWDELAEIARRRRTETTLIFASLHNLLALKGSGDEAAARELAAAIARHGLLGSDDQAIVAGSVGAGVARVITDGTAGTVDALELARHLVALGGSFAQRDVFLRTLAAAAAESGDGAAARAVCDIRRQRRSADRFDAAVAAVLARPGAAAATLPA
jgi:tetratricopeptide (TPR) repeat protein